MICRHGSAQLNKGGISREGACFCIELSLCAWEKQKQKWREPNNILSFRRIWLSDHHRSLKSNSLQRFNRLMWGTDFIRHFQWSHVHGLHGGEWQWIAISLASFHINHVFSIRSIVYIFLKLAQRAKKKILKSLNWRLSNEKIVFSKEVNWLSSLVEWMRLLKLLIYGALLMRVMKCAIENDYLIMLKKTRCLMSSKINNFSTHL